MEEKSGSNTQNLKPVKQYRSRRKTAQKGLSLTRSLSSGINNIGKKKKEGGPFVIKSKSPELLLAVIIVFFLVVAAIVSGNIRNKKSSAPDALPSFVKVDYIGLDRYTRPGILNPGIRRIVFIPSEDAGQTASRIRADFIRSGSEGIYSSSHFAVGEDGSVLCCIPLDEVACGRYAGIPDTISVTYGRSNASDAGTSSDAGMSLDSGMSSVEYQALIELGRWLKERYKLTAEAFVSSDETVFLSSGLEKETGDSFWVKYRAEVEK